MTEALRLGHITPGDESPGWRNGKPAEAGWVS
jgi:hypothetical protein